MENIKRILFIVLVSVISLFYISETQSLASEIKTNEPLNSKADSNELNLPEYAKDVLEFFPKWEVIQYDEKPSLKVDGYDGYRLVLRQSWKDYSSSLQQSMPQQSSSQYTLDNLKYDMKYNHIELVLFKNDNTIPNNIIENIPWLELEQVQFIKPVYMGKGRGFDWFANTTLYFQENIRKGLNLTDGDDRINLLTEALFIKDEGTCTANSVMFLISDFGDKAVESIKRAVKTNSDKDPWHAILALHTIPSNKCAELLKQYYHSDDSHISSAAGYSLIYKPFKIQAKKEYFDMLKKQKYIREIGKACEEFNWKDALPIFEDICSKPKSWSNYYIAYLQKRNLEGHPVPEELLKAQETINMSAYSTEKIDSNAIAEAKRIIIESPDKNASVLIAFNIFKFRTKASNDLIEQINNIGLDILNKLPKSETTKLYKILKESLVSEEDRDLLQKFQEILN